MFVVIYNKQKQLDINVCMQYMQADMLISVQSINSWLIVANC